MAPHLVKAILRQGKGKYDTRHHGHGAENKQQFKHLIERVAGHDVVQKQNAHPAASAPELIVLVGSCDIGESKSARRGKLVTSFICMLSRRTDACR